MLRVALDGEVMHMVTPLRHRVRRAALEVMAAAASYFSSDLILPGWPSRPAAGRRPSSSVISG